MLFDTLTVGQNSKNTVLRIQILNPDWERLIESGSGTLGTCMSRQISQKINTVQIQTTGTGSENKDIEVVTSTGTSTGSVADSDSFLQIWIQALKLLSDPDL